MRNLSYVISQCFEYYRDSQRCVHESEGRERSLFLTVPLSADEFLVPTFVLPSLKECSWGGNSAPDVAVHLNYIGGYSDYKSLDAAFRDSLQCSYEKTRLVRLPLSKPTDKPYYATWGAVFDNDYNPVMMTMWRLSKHHEVINKGTSFESLRVRVGFSQPILWISPSVVINKGNAVERYLANKVIPTALSIPHVYTPYNLGAAFSSGSSSCYPIKVEICKCPFSVKAPCVPSASTSNASLLDVALNHLDEIVP